MLFQLKKTTSKQKDLTILICAYDQKGTKCYYLENYKIKYDAGTQETGSKVPVFLFSS
jgi:hypothetical protein